MGRPILILAATAAAAAAAAILSSAHAGSATVRLAPETFVIRCNAVGLLSGSDYTYRCASLGQPRDTVACSFTVHGARCSWPRHAGEFAQGIIGSAAAAPLVDPGAAAAPGAPQAGLPGFAGRRSRMP